MKEVRIDSGQRNELREDTYDRMLIEQRKNEDSVSWTEVKRELQACKANFRAS